MESAFKALADKNRRSIIDYLKSGRKNAGEIQDHIRTTGATASHHLDILKRANLVVPEREGQFIFYSLNISVLEELVETVFKLFSFTANEEHE
jgi:DNA-binding transcriptional ArsR family regulator